VDSMAPAKPALETCRRAREATPAIRSRRRSLRSAGLSTS
jgi:hypothetical protein